MFTRKDFVKIATTLLGIEDLAERRIEAEDYSNIFRDSNPRFDYSRFMAACHLEVLLPAVA